MTEEWSFGEGGLDATDVRALLTLHFREMRAGSPPDACHVLPIDDLDRPDIRLFTLREGGQLLGVGALKLIEPGHGEIKSMRTAPDALGRGVGRAMIKHLLAEARTMGLTRISLETGSTQLFAGALRLYEQEGFTACGPFGTYRDTPFTRFFTREL